MVKYSSVQRARVLSLATPKTAHKGAPRFRGSWLRATRISKKNNSFLIIIPCETVTLNLEKTIFSIKQQAYKQWKVVVVLSHSTKEKIPGITFIVDKKTKHNPSRKRNYALKFQHFDFVLFLDDDVILEKNFLENARNVLKLKNVSAVVGPQLTPPESAFLQKVSGRILESGLTSLKYSPQKDPPSHKASEGKSYSLDKEVEVQDYSCAAMVVRLTDFKKIGGFSEQFFPGEDTKLCLDITKQLHTQIIRSNNVIAYHERKPFGILFLRQMARYGFQRGRFAVLFPETSLHPLYFLSTSFLLYLMVLLGFFLLAKNVFAGLWIPFLAYLFFLTCEVAIVYAKEKRLGLALLVGIGIVLTHIIYGVQFGRGLLNTLNFPLFRKEGVGRVHQNKEPLLTSRLCQKGRKA